MIAKNLEYIDEPETTILLEMASEAERILNRLIASMKKNRWSILLATGY
jgi:hypothetical protein